MNKFFTEETLYKALRFASSAEAMESRLTKTSEDVSSKSFEVCDISVKVDFYFNYTDTDIKVNPHAHNTYEISNVLMGNNQYQIESESGEEIVFHQPGQILVIPRTVVHQWQSKSTPLLLASFVAHFDPFSEEGEKWLSLFEKKVREERFLITPSSQTQEIEKLIFSYYTSTELSLIVWQAINHLLQLFIIELFQTVIGEDLLRHEKEVRQRKQDIFSYRNLVHAIEQMIMENIYNPISMEDISSHFQLSTRHLNRIFKQEKKDSIGKYILTQKIDKATELLQSTNKSVKEVAYILGFKDPGYFSTFYKRKTGIAPQSVQGMKKSGKI